MSDVSGIPNLGIPGMSGFSGGGAFAPGGSFGTWSAPQINASMGYSPNAAAFNPWGGTTGGFGNMTDYYSALGANYGLQTGYYGDTLGLTPGQTTPAAQAANPWVGYNFDNSSYLSGLGQYQQPAASSFDPYAGFDWSSLYQQPAAPAFDWSSYYQPAAADPWAGYDNSSWLSGLGQYQQPAQPAFDPYAGFDWSSLYQQQAAPAFDWSSYYQPAAPDLNPWAGTQWDNSSWLSGLGQYGAGSGNVANDWPTYLGGGGGDFSFPAAPQVDWSAAFNQFTAPQSPYANNSGGIGGGGWSFDDYGNPFQSLGGWGQAPAAAPNPWASLGYDPSTLYANAMGYPGGGVSSWFDPSSYSGAQGSGEWTDYSGVYNNTYAAQLAAMLGGGGYNEATGWAGDPYAGTQWANPFQQGVGPTTSGWSNAPAYQGNPYYMPAPMQGGQDLWGGGGLGAWGFGIGQQNYTGQPGFGLGIGSISNYGLPPAYGSQPGGNPFGGGQTYGFGGLYDAPYQIPDSISGGVGG